MTLLDLGLNNIGSVRNAFGDIGLAAEIESLETLKYGGLKCNLLVIPGTGNFGAAMGKLIETGLDTMLRNYATSGGSILGICLGMQLLFESSEEAPGIPGLSILEGQVVRLPPNLGARVHIGWSDTLVDEEVAEDVGSPSLDFYFVHSFHCQPRATNLVTYTTEFGGSSIAAGVRHQNVVGLQFHPEKSSLAGRYVLEAETRRLLA